MGTVVPYIAKFPISKGEGYPIKYADLEGAFAGRIQDDIYLRVYFGSAHHVEAENEHGAGAGQVRYRLLGAGFAPDLARAYQRPGYPWHGIDKPLVIGLSVSAIPREVSAAAKVNHMWLRDLVRNQLQALTTGNWPAQSWSLYITWLVDERAIECISARWHGLRQGPESKVVVPFPVSAIHKPATNKLKPKPPPVAYQQHQLRRIICELRDLAEQVEAGPPAHVTKYPKSPRHPLWWKYVVTAGLLLFAAVDLGGLRDDAHLYNILRKWQSTGYGRPDPNTAAAHAFLEICHKWIKSDQYGFIVEWTRSQGKEYRAFATALRILADRLEDSLAKEV